MARRFFKKKSRSYSGFKRRASRSSGSGTNTLNIAISAAAYGAFRNKIHYYIPNTGLPYSDSLISGAVGYYLSKKGGWMKSAGIAILAVEAAAVGSTLMDGSKAPVSTGSAFNDY